VPRVPNQPRPYQSSAALPLTSARGRASTGRALPRPDCRAGPCDPRRSERTAPCPPCRDCQNKQRRSLPIHPFLSTRRLPRRAVRRHDVRHPAVLSAPRLPNRASPSTTDLDPHNLNVPRLDCRSSTDDATLALPRLSPAASPRPESPRATSQRHATPKPRQASPAVPFTAKPDTAMTIAAKQTPRRFSTAEPFLSATRDTPRSLSSAALPRLEAP